MEREEKERVEQARIAKKQKQKVPTFNDLGHQGNRCLEILSSIIRRKKRQQKQPVHSKHPHRGKKRQEGTVWVGGGDGGVHERRWEGKTRRRRAVDWAGRAFIVELE